MELRKISIALLALLLVTMALLPMASAAGTCQSGSVKETEKISTILPGNSANLLDEFGLEKPVVNEKAAPFLSYERSKDLADKIFRAGKLPDDTKSVIGMYNFGDSQMLLINRGDQVLEAFYNGKTVNTYLLTPRLLGDKTVTGDPRNVVGPEGDSGDYTLTTTVRTQLYSLDFIYPEGDTVIADSLLPLSSYTVTRSRTDVYRNGAGTTVAQLITKGVFYVNYGSSITGISNGSSYWLNPTQPGWVFCFYHYQTSGIGTTVGRLDNQFKFGQLYLRDEMDIWVSVDAWLTGSDGGSSNQWISLSPDGCS